MSDSKNMFILNPDYYSAGSYEEDERTNPILQKVLMQLVLLAVVFVSLFFAYGFIIKNDLISLSSLFPDKVEPLVSHQKITTPRPKIVIREEGELIETVIPSIKKQIFEDVPLKEEVKKVEVKKVKVPKEPILNDNLTDEYINLVKKSLGNN